MKEIILYTDGACSGNPGPGGWAAILSYKEHTKEVAGYEPDTTNNRMELMAALRGLQMLTEPCKVNIYSDSGYMVRAFSQGWLDKWQNNGWQTAAKKPVENQDLWSDLLEQYHRHSITFHKVAGHSDDKQNNRCDELATGQIKMHRKTSIK